ncbi:sigma-70 family RNA polymerase sigma factor [Actinoalloteichus sp. AHMU CJ021]|uniref:sigma-70 family RNA polymerase sigma factor n=1 Tax=Actinoalloteichus sp. AHMU CJ021 TaxID=2072503 RepID=UPI0026CA85BB
MADPGNTHGTSDEDLIDAVRQGVTSAYGELYVRHVDAARNLSRQLARTPIEADDLVSEAFARVLQVLRTGGGPDSAFRAYLLTSLRHTAYDRTRRERRVELSEDVGAVAGAALAVPFTDTAVAGLERSLAARAFARLPERWQTVLWHTEIEGQPPSAVAPILGLSANGVAALAYRAREGLRQAFLQEHLSEVGATSRCRAVAERLGAWTRDGLSRRETAQVETHLDGCERCRTLASELADLNGALRGVAFVVLGVGAGGYLATAAATSLTGAGVGAVTGSTAGAVSGLISGAPRQWLGAASSAAALAAAMVLGLLSGGPAPDPVAQPSDPPASESLPLPEVPTAPPTVRDPVQLPLPPPTPSPSPPHPPRPADPPPPPEETPEPVGARLEATVPDSSLVLVAGGEPVDLPITVRNTGDRASEPVTVSLDLPKGVTATGRTVPDAPSGSRPAGDTPGTGAGEPPAPDPAARPRTGAEPPSPRAAEDPTGAAPAAPSPVPTTVGEPDVCVQHPTGTRVTCRSVEGVPAGGDLTLHIQLTASVDAEAGAISGTLHAGTAIHLRLATITVTVRPATVDHLALGGSALRTPGGGWPAPAELRAEVTNTGTSTAPVSVELRLPWWVRVDGLPPRCDLRSDAFRHPHSSWVVASALPPSVVRCESPGEVAPGDRHDVRLRLRTWLPVETPIRVTARLGAAREALDLRLTAARPALRVEALGVPEPLPPGGPAGSVTYRLRNTGNAPTGPVTVRAEVPRHFALDGGEDISCDGRGRLVHCHVPGGLEPGEQADLPLVVRALAAAASAGEVTGHVRGVDGALTRLPAVRLDLAERPSGVAVSTGTGPAWSTPSPSGAGHRSYHAVLRVRVSNVGQTTAPARLEATLPPGVRMRQLPGWPLDPPRGLAGCPSGSTRPRPTPPLSPGSSRHLVLWFCAEGGRDVPPASSVALLARLGDSEHPTSVRVEWSHRPFGGPAVGEAPDPVEDVDRDGPPAPRDAADPEPRPRAPAPPEGPPGPAPEHGVESRDPPRPDRTPEAPHRPSPPSTPPPVSGSGPPQPGGPPGGGRDARSVPLPSPPSLDSGVMRRLSDTFGRRNQADRHDHPPGIGGRSHG